MMLKRPAIIAALLATTGAVWGQSTKALSFEVASLKPVSPHESRAWRRPIVGADRIEFYNVTLWYCISFAYGTKSFQMSGPGWLREARYDVVARGPAGTGREDLPKMMQTLLGERFRLQAHQETRDLPILVLMPGKHGRKLQQAAPESGDGLGGARVAMSASESGAERLEIRGGGMSTLANTLTGLLGAPVVDKTGLTGLYDVILEFSRSEAAGPGAAGGFNEPPPLPPPPPGAEPGVSIYTSIQQLGLRLVPRRLPMNVLVVDSADRVPIEN
jgi:uncharacterized protein (TIGR03435 family)